VGSPRGGRGEHRGRGEAGRGKKSGYTGKAVGNVRKAISSRKENISCTRKKVQRKHRERRKVRECAASTTRGGKLVTNLTTQVIQRQKALLVKDRDKKSSPGQKSDTAPGKDGGQSQVRTETLHATRMGSRKEGGRPNTRLWKVYISV